MEQKEALVQNLEDAGCTAEMISHFLNLEEFGETGDQLNLLSKHRDLLLHYIHEYQIKLDCLDYLIHKMRNEIS